MRAFHPSFRSSTLAGAFVALSLVPTRHVLAQSPPESSSVVDSSKAAPPSSLDPLATTRPSAPAAKDESTPYLFDPIVITGTRTKKLMLDVPFAMDRVALEEKRFARQVSVSDVLEDIPGLFMQSRYGNHDVRISMRGFGSRSNTGIRGVRILLDGIPESEPDGQTRIEAIDFQALGSIEVVKGNASSLYTNAPGGVINFMSDLGFTSSSVVSYNQLGSHDLRQNGLKARVRTDNHGLLTTYSYHNSLGYREHSADYWHIANVNLETNPTERGTLRLFAYMADGRIRLPGSLTKEEFEENPLQANQRDLDRDTKRITKKGRIGVRFESALGDDEFEITSYASIKYFERTAGTYRLFNRDGLGGTVRYVNRHRLFGRPNELSGAVDAYYQYGPIQEYENIAGQKGDILLGLTDERIGNTGAYVSNSLDLVAKRLSLLTTARYDNVFFDVRNQILAVQNSRRTFHDFTPKAALHFKVTPEIALYTSYGLGFDTPAGNELDNFPTSSDPNRLINPDLNPQHSQNLELGVKGSVKAELPGIERVTFGGAVYSIRVEDEIVPFDVFGDVFYRNSAVTKRHGLELGVDVALAGGFRFKGAYTYSDFKYDDYLAGTVLIDDFGEFVIDNEDFSGNVVPSVPTNNASASVSYERRLAKGLTGFAKVHASLASGMYVDDANSEKTVGYTIVDPTIGMNLDVGPVSLLASGGFNNVFDEAYVGFVNINSASREFYEAGEPRSSYVSVNLGRRF